MKHTPISYGWDGISRCFFIPEIPIADTQSPHGLSISSENWANFIVRVCNNHYKLLEVSKDMAKTVCRLCKEVDPTLCPSCNGTSCDVMDDWKAVIAEAEKEGKHGTGNGH